jgi:oligopeptide transport system substrate-binding protein
MVKNLGVVIEWQEIEWRMFTDRMLGDTPHMWMVGLWAEYPDPDDFLRIQWWISPDWHNPEFDCLVEDARGVMDQEERMRMYRQSDRIMIEMAPLLPLVYGRFHILVNPRVKNFITTPLDWWSWKNVILESP